MVPNLETNHGSVGLRVRGNTYCWHMLTRSLSVVPGLSPLMYKLVLDSCSEPEELFGDELVLFGMLLLSEVDTVPL